ncbi:MAG: hypothetical protein A2275_13240 [Bacteroidetes bacterium RIFOXYA12_FULL_35_11]|nr:MAG: hypothetical protein A2X01_11525 [Bacteroidetes bacterium GWF2_35_48]OFY72684.1 MAG: hypothetical protein A2275_13240 [Bacteroidetes bacterium RIFOXYA12_FULL_35_11]OFY92615.1 MAG: hypothetical protein A2491_05280 [Bacteroidetes bacterium RIFOXYC12_FULL_35_7]OFY93432.1 MAG: hypothetical protein A2309_03680 [Bacteroidetes bacterium RIFOXYB2_FULL_35_7]HBX50995.1 hypothetical protein [Bacteroidales bacterium]
MTTKTFILFLIAGSLLFSCTRSTEMKTNKLKMSQWRGKYYAGVFDEKNLLKYWSEEGPAMLWKADSIGNGYGSPIVYEDKLYVMGEKDSIGTLYAFDLNGKELWKVNYGKEWGRYFPGSRSTPTIVDGLLYLESGFGRVVCMEATTGKEKWAVDMLKDLNGRNTNFGFSESPLVDEKNVYCMPGGHDTNVVALDRMTGKINWISKGMCEEPSYCSPIIIHLPERSILVTFSKQHLLGIDIKDGSLLWSDFQHKDGDTHGNSPMYENYYNNHYIYYVAGDGQRGVKLKLSDAGSKITALWRNKLFDNAYGGFVKQGDYLYGSGHRKKNWFSLNVRTGQICDSLKINRGITVMADSMLYCYNEKGEIFLVKARDGKMEKISSLKIKHGSKEHFAHPYIANGVLYIRHGKALMAFDIKRKAA